MPETSQDKNNYLLTESTHRIPERKRMEQNTDNNRIHNSGEEGTRLKANPIHSFSHTFQPFCS
ncbi:MAG TPA: hypothetical protein DD381_09515 [Lentisphaeria bacterium]|nr:MAG: hypothetical protein A2X47_11310 [Lentisphaerae bacterium GWF2_38_69]HBM16562.1 hypothetical protein [Lentisphaeria bacterium]